jgi:hypothetical protein
MTEQNTFKTPEAPNDHHDSTHNETDNLSNSSLDLMKGVNDLGKGLQNLADSVKNALGNIQLGDAQNGNQLKTTHSNDMLGGFQLVDEKAQPGNHAGSHVRGALLNRLQEGDQSGSHSNEHSNSDLRGQMLHRLLEKSHSDEQKHFQRGSLLDSSDLAPGSVRGDNLHKALANMDVQHQGQIAYRFAPTGNDMLPGRDPHMSGYKMDNQSLLNGFNGSNERWGGNYQASNEGGPYHINPLKTVIDMWKSDKGQKSWTNELHNNAFHSHLR